MQPEPASTLNKDLSEREDHPLHVPWQETWRREPYETVLAKAWPLVVGPLVGHGIGSRAYMPVEVEPRLRPVAAHLAYARVSVSDQEAFLQAAGVDPKDRGTWPRRLGWWGLGRPPISNGDGRRLAASDPRRLHRKPRLDTSHRVRSSDTLRPRSWHAEAPRAPPPRATRWSPDMGQTSGFASHGELVAGTCRRVDVNSRMPGPFDSGGKAVKLWVICASAGCPRPCAGTRSSGSSMRRKSIVTTLRAQR
jgi:hypothetical protein